MNLSNAIIDEHQQLNYTGSSAQGSFDAIYTLRFSLLYLLIIDPCGEHILILSPRLCAPDMLTLRTRGLQLNHNAYDFPYMSF